MAATYSSFMTTRYYSPIFNTALFDGPLRFYFSQSYESSALKLYHLLQAQHEDLWSQLKKHTQANKEHVFVMIYPEAKDLKMVFENVQSLTASQTWDEGLALGMYQPTDDEQVAIQLQEVVQSIKNWMQLDSTNEITL